MATRWRAGILQEEPHTNYVYFCSPLFQFVELEDSVVVCRTAGLAAAANRVRR